MLAKGKSGASTSADHCGSGREAQWHSITDSSGQGIQWSSLQKAHNDEFCPSGEAYNPASNKRGPECSTEELQTKPAVNLQPAHLTALFTSKPSKTPAWKAVPVQRHVQNWSNRQGREGQAWLRLHSLRDEPGGCGLGRHPLSERCSSQFSSASCNGLPARVFRSVQFSSTRSSRSRASSR